MCVDVKNRLRMYVKKSLVYVSIKMYKFFNIKIKGRKMG